MSQQPVQTPAETALATSDVMMSSSAQMPPAPLESRLFRGHDPLEEFAPDPFAAGGMHRVFGSGFGRVMERLEHLSEAMLGTRPVLPSPPMPAGASYSVQTASMSSFLGEDGQMHTEQFASSDVGHREQDIRETHQAYYDSSSGTRKAALEQHLGPQAVKTVKQQVGDAPEQIRNMYLGMEDSTEATDAFKQGFDAKAEHLPQHQDFSGSFFTRFGATDTLPLGGAGKWRQGALESGGSKGGA